VKRREVLVSLAVAGAGVALGGCAGRPGADVDPRDPSDAQLGTMLRQLSGLDLRPGEGPSVLRSFKGSRFTAHVDPTIQPQADFDPEVDP